MPALSSSTASVSAIGEEWRPLEGDYNATIMNATVALPTEPRASAAMKPLGRTAKPSQIVKVLDEYVIGQDEAKKTLAVAVYSHFRKIEKSERDDVPIVKSNVLLIGPSGTGKTLTCETLSRMLGVPFVTAEATSLAQTRFVNEEIDAILQRLIDKAGGDLAQAQQGIVFIDEIDKLKAPDATPHSASGESVQHALLKIMEGSQVRIGAGRYIDTTNILFICGGAFVGLDDIMAQNHGFGFIATSDDENRKILDRLNTRVKPTDLFTYGLIPEFTGRLPIIARFRDLTREMLVRIMTEPRDSIYSQFREIFAQRGRRARRRAQGVRADLGARHRVQDRRTQPARACSRS